MSSSRQLAAAWRDRLHRLRTETDDRGSAPVEMAIIGIPALMFIALLYLGGSIVITANTIGDVASAAARDASIARNATTAQQLAHAAALDELDKQGLHCEGGGPHVDVDTSGFAAPPGQQASIRVDVTCVVRLGDVGIPDIPGSKTLHAHASSPLDPYRSIALGFSNPDGASPR